MFLSKSKPKKRVLVVDDSRETADLTRVLLEKAHFEVSLADNASMAREELKKAAPDAILLDINLPDGNGLDLLGECKKLHPQVPVVVFTSEGYSEDKMEVAQQRGASGYVSKYMGPDAVVVAIRNVIPKEAKKQEEGVGEENTVKGVSEE